MSIRFPKLYNQHMSYKYHDACKFHSFTTFKPASLLSDLSEASGPSFIFFTKLFSLPPVRPSICDPGIGWPPYAVFPGACAVTWVEFPSA